MRPFFPASFGAATLCLLVAGGLSEAPIAPPPPPGAAETNDATVPENPVPSPPRSRPATQDNDPECSGIASVFVFPAAPDAGRPVRLVVVARDELLSPVLEIRTPGLSRLLAPIDRWGSGPRGWEFESEGLPAGEVEVRVRTADARHAAGCLPLRVTNGSGGREREAEGEAVWPIRAVWTPALEDLYAVWISRLFRVPAGFRGGWRRLHIVLRDPERNLLHDALGWREDGAAQDPDVDGPAIRARADCGDLPYALRAYFSWKMGLPFRFQRCLRGSAAAGAECYEERSNLSPRFGSIADPVERFNRFLETDLANGVHSATARTLPDDETSDFYPVQVLRSSLRPGVVYVWPYGHLLVLTDVLDDGPEGPVLLAVDGHVDGSVTVKRFGPRTFPYAPGLRTPGFKAFRPVRFDGDAIRPLDNGALRDGAGPSPLSVDQYRFRHAEEFYRAVEDAVRNGPPGSHASHDIVPAPGESG